ncbi:MAG: universal stress protein [Rhodospirillales bacterium]|nr:universal stress protein [Rhodospirillales bacterium]
MPLKDLLVHIDSSDQCQSRLETALNLAQANDAHLTGVFVVTRPNIPAYIEAQIGAEVIKAQIEEGMRAADEAEKMFSAKTQSAGVKSEWRSVEGDLCEVLGLHGRYADLVIVGQRDPEGSDMMANSDMPDRLILSVGRPVLVVPYVGTYPTIGQRVMVAWDGSRLAARAVNDSLSLLLGAKTVNILAVNPKRGTEGLGDVPGGDISLHLARHGIKAEAQHLTSGDISAGDMLLSRAADAGADLIVMGAYGHARWRELVLGGVTRHMLNHMTVPVFMSH